MTTSTYALRPEQRAEIVRQIGAGVVLSISGGRIARITDGIELPVSNGYRVRVQLTPADTYTVSRVFTRAGREFVKGRMTDVYCDGVSDAAYYAGMFRSHDAEGWVSAAVSGR